MFDKLVELLVTYIFSLQIAMPGMSKLVIEIFIFKNLCITDPVSYFSYLVLRFMTEITDVF